MQKVRLLNRSSLTIGTCALLMFSLSACESSGNLRLGGIGTPGAGSGGTADGDGSGGTGDGSGGVGSGGSGGTGGGGTPIADGGGAGPGGSGGNGGTGGTGGTGGSGNSGGALGSAVTGVAGPVLATAGNAVLGVSNGVGGVLTPVATALPVTQPVTGTITKILTDTGAVLVDAGEGRTLLVEGALGVVGDVLTINVGDRAVTSPIGEGGNGAIGLGALGGNQPTGTIATVGVLNAGNAVLADVNGLAGVRISNITAPTGGASGELLNVALGGNQLLGSGAPGLVNANLLANGVPAVGGASGATGILAPVTSLAGNLTGGAGASGVVGVVQEAVSNVVSAVPVIGGGSAGGSGLVGAVQQTVGGVLGAVPALGGVAGTGATVDAGAAVSTGGAGSGLLGPVTGAVDGTAAGSGLLGGVGTAVNGTVNGVLGGLLPNRP